ncbi:MAG: S9 family peptidase [Pseudomonadales bacterium]|nr:S9 family peptidase [Pseudomonadales bacterium]
MKLTCLSRGAPGLLVASFVLPVYAAELPTFSADDVFELEFAADPRISPDGATIVYERRANDIMSDRTRSDLWVLDVDGGRHRPLVTGGPSATDPRISPDGDRLAWIESDDDGPAIRVRWFDAPESARVAHLPERPRNLSWSPDGRWLAFTMAIEGKNEPLVKPRKGPEGSDWSAAVKTFSAVRYKRDGAGFVTVSHEHVFVVPAEGGTPRQLTEGDFDHRGPLAWSADGARIYFSANRDADWQYEAVESDLWSVAVADGVLEQLTDMAGAEANPVVSPDGRRLAYLHDSGEKVAWRPDVLRVLDLRSGEDRALTADLDVSVQHPQWSDARTLYYAFDEQGARKVARIGLRGEPTVVAETLGGTSLGRPYLSGDFTVSPEGVVAFTYGTAERPAEVAVVDGRGPRALTALNEELLGRRALGEVHELRYTSSHDGLPIQGWYITPPDYEPGRAYPTILEIHGGPHLAYGPQFSAEMQRYAAAGYVVFYDNHRGSTGYGEEFALALQYLYSSEADYADHDAGLDALVERGIADPDRLYITGGSAGGIASAYAIGLTDRFRAAAVQKPIINWTSKVLTGDSYVYQVPFQFPGPPWENLEHYWQRSPLSLVGNVTTPTLLITGEEDQRTPISETEQFYQALKLRRIDAVMVRVPGSSHGIAGRPSRLNAKVDNVLAWFERYGGEPLDGGDGDDEAAED